MARVGSDRSRYLLVGNREVVIKLSLDTVDSGMNATEAFDMELDSFFSVILTANVINCLKS